MHSKSNRRIGLTLTELLVVVAIVVIVIGVLAPLLTNGMEGREVREAARQINAYFQTARTRAKQLGRPVGVLIHRSENDPNKCYQLSLAEEVPPYRGFDEFERALSRHVDEHRDAASGRWESQRIRRRRHPAQRRNPFWLPWPRYRIVAVDPAASQLKVHDDNATQRLPNVLESQPLTFEVYRRPRPSLSTPIDLPVGAVVWLQASGVGLGTGDMTEGSATIDESAMGANRPGYIGLTEFQAVDPAALTSDFGAPFDGSRMPLAIMFSPTGEVDRVYRFLPPYNVAWPQYAMFPPKRPQDKIYLFVGKENPEAGVLAEILDGTNLWITIDPLSGTVNSAANSGLLVPDPNWGAVVSKSRQLAAAGQSVGGR